MDRNVAREERFYTRVLAPLPSREWPTQALYKKPADWLSRNQIGSDLVKRQLETYLRLAPYSQSFELHVLHNEPHLDLVRQRDGEEPIVWHDPTLDTYWGRLRAAIIA